MAGLTAVLVSGCGTDDERPSIASVPLAPGLVVDAEHYECIEVGLCGQNLIIRGDSDSSADSLLNREVSALRRGGWEVRRSNRFPPLEADSPNGRLHLTLATARGMVDEFAQRGVPWDEKLAAKLRAVSGGRTAALAGSLESDR